MSGTGRRPPPPGANYTDNQTQTAGKKRRNNRKKSQASASEAETPTSSRPVTGSTGESSDQGGPSSSNAEPTTTIASLTIGDSATDPGTNTQRASQEAPKPWAPKPPRTLLEFGGMPKQILHPMLTKADTSGKDGTTFRILTNHFPIQIPSLQDVYQYNLEITDQTPGRTFGTRPTNPRLKRRILWLLLNKSDFKKVATNYADTLVSTEPLDDHRGAKGVQVHYWQHFEPQPATPPPTSYLVQFSHRSTYDMRDFWAWARLTNTTQPFPDKEAALNLLNILISRRALQGPAAVETKNSRVFLTNLPATQKTDLGGGLEAYSGFFRSARCGQKLVLNINNATSAFYKELFLDDLFNEWSILNRSKFTRGDVPGWELRRRHFGGFIKGVRVIVHYRKVPWHMERQVSRRIKTVIGVCSGIKNREPTEENVMFNLDNGGQRSVQEHFERFGESGNGLELFTPKN